MSIIKSFLKRKYEIFSLFNEDIKPLNAWAFVRAYSEIETIKHTLSTMLRGGVKRGVIAYHLDENGEDDGTGEYIEQFCKENVNFISLRYPYKIIDHMNKEIYRKGPGAIPKELRLDSYYNFTLDKIPNDNWFIKIDSDQIYNEVALAEVLKQPRNRFESICLPRIDMHYENGELYFIRNIHYPNSLIPGSDHWLMYKNKDIYFSLSFEGGWEKLEYPNNIQFLYAKNIVSMHFPLMKKSRRHLATPDILVPYDNYDFSQLNLTEVDKEFLLNKDKILSYFK